MALIGSLTSGVSALITFEKGMEVIGNNIANVNTTGFKTTRMEYADAFSNVLQTSTPPPISGIGSNTPAKQIGGLTFPPSAQAPSHPSCASPTRK